MSDMIDECGEFYGNDQTDRFGARQFAGLCAEFLLRRAHRSQDIGITGAAAEIAGKIFAHLIVAGIGVLFEQRLYREHEARRTVGALQCPLLDPRLLDRMERCTVIEPFQSRNMVSSRSCRE